jgi:transcriptional regulator with XRE-family HTH domain
MTFGERLKQLRTEKGLTQVELSKIIMVNQGTIACYETNKKFPTHDNLKRLADFFSVSTDYLLGRTDTFNQVQEEKTEYKIDNEFTEEEQKQIEAFKEFIKSRRKNNEEAAVGE